MFNPNVLAAKIVNQPQAAAVISLVARILLAWIFIVSGWGKVSDYAGTVGYMQAMGVSAALLPLVIFAELGGGLAILFGFQARVAALGLAVFSLLTAFLFHSANDMNNAINFMKNLGLAGGFLALALLGAGKLSIDYLIEKK
jgi:putative oxidoreductase